MASAVVVAAASAARAEEENGGSADLANEGNERVERPWTISAGIGWTGAIVGGLGSGPALPVAGLATVERRIGGPVSLVARLTGAYDRFENIGSEGSLLGGAASLGVRVALTSPEIAEVSARGLVTGSAWFGRGDVASRGRGLGGELGFAVDREIVPGLGARLSVGVARAAHQWFTLYPGSAYETWSSGTSFAVGLFPAAELRWSF